ncbi:hypothetical protein Ocin01_19218 [Orchesella cincta]|uniref:Uncharacterized protein n=1 Tax=Orchesella cincta TaxID=48709 RepID=A0A1D2M3E6_ORCCI|nr:hypothetical protein Ocin01_19218 [Orchesella cincta]
MHTIKMKVVILTMIILLALCGVQVSGEGGLTYGDKCGLLEQNCDFGKGLACFGTTCSCPLFFRWDGGLFGSAGLLGGGRCVSAFNGSARNVGMMYATPLAITVTVCANLMLRLLF